MSRIPALLALSVLGLFTSTAAAQVFQGRTDPSPRSIAGAVNERNNLELCGTSGGGTRVRESNCEVETTTLRTETELKLSIEMPAIQSKECAATTTTEYFQKNTAAHVEGAIAISDCAAAAGTYKVAVRVRNEGAEDKVLEFEETWQRGDDKDVTFTADYPIGDDAELVSVRVRGLTCSCADPPKTE